MKGLIVKGTDLKYIRRYCFTDEGKGLIIFEHGELRRLLLHAYFLVDINIIREFNVP